MKASKRVLLIKLNDNLFVHINTIARVGHIGNYTEIKLMDGQTYTIWDVHCLILNKIRKLTED